MSPVITVILWAAIGFWFLLMAAIFLGTVMDRMGRPPRSPNHPANHEINNPKESR